MHWGNGRQKEFACVKCAWLSGPTLHTLSLSRRQCQEYSVMTANQPTLPLPTLGTAHLAKRFFLHSSLSLSLSLSLEPFRLVDYKHTHTQLHTEIYSAQSSPVNCPNGGNCDEEEEGRRKRESTFSSPIIGRLANWSTVSQAPLLLLLAAAAAIAVICITIFLFVCFVWVLPSVWKCGATLGMSMSMSMLTLNEVMVVFEVVVVVVVGQVLWRGCSVAVLFDGHCLFVYPIHPLFLSA